MPVYIAYFCLLRCSLLIVLQYSRKNPREFLVLIMSEAKKSNAVFIESLLQIFIQALKALY